ncbi:winged helix-turn-helix transcriptional regulator [Paractinoplanes durhamensis]|uniref:Cinnamoyl ester hydrolase n=1 Tax=Paractinoplanes durhamensis TaxID=113563 RepID=A0ABQ3YRY6_9ACTN|nr:helix-turn-helix domain-containing protein [Actinoplanes durhamensis]GIE00348.1 cinnamoyl ester hydrolase [Actinoplanes durhamensis]
MTAACRTGEHDKHDVYAVLCPCRDVFEVLTNKWSALTIGALADGPQRYTALQTRLQGVSPKVLSATVRRLEAYGFLTRTVYPAVPSHVVYELTDLGHSVCAPLAALSDWVEEHVDRIRAAAK